MAAKARSADGCWTCRLRRKKCDEGHPVCAACAALEIDCLYSDAKPEWMDGGARQREEADKLKAEVKRKAGGRRDRKYMHSLEQDMGDLTMTTTAASTDDSPDEWCSQAVSNGSVGHVTNESPSDSGPDSSAHTGRSPPVSMVSSWTTTVTPASPLSSLANAAGDLKEQDLVMMMVYLDHVFPFLFPFYRPSMIEGTRGWLLVLLVRSKALFHTALTLSSYFFSVAVQVAMPRAEDGSNDEHVNACSSNAKMALQHHQEGSFRELQREIHGINAGGGVVPGGAYSVIGGSRVLEAIIQLLVFEVIAGDASNSSWPVHLDACLALFDQILATTEPGRRGWQKLVKSLGADLLAASGYGNIIGDEYRPYTADEAAMRFYTAILIQVDIVSSTVLEQAPRLQKYHPALLMPGPAEADDSDNDQQLLPPALDMASFIGVRNWVLLAIGAIAELDAWKKDMKRAGCLSMVELVTRAGAIETELRAHMAQLVANGGAHNSSNGGGTPNGINACHSSRCLQVGTILFCPRDHTADALLSYIWAQAALTYLCIVVSGWQPANADTRASVALTVQLLQRLHESKPQPAAPASSLPLPPLPAPTLRNAVWPFCLTGCLALGADEQQVFRDMAGALGPLHVFGTVHEALAIMEHVWAHRTEIERNSDAWDFAACLRSLGRRSLLV